MIAIVVTLGLAFQNPAAGLRSEPNLNDYRVPPTDLYQGAPAAPRFKTSGQRKFRTMIREAARKQADFAGRYAIAQWGCGGGCVQVAVVDEKSGDVFDGPFGTLPSARISFGAAEDEGLVYRRDSRLLIARGCPNETACGVYYYEWTGSRFKLLNEIHP